MKFKKLTAMLTALACAGVLASSFGMIASATASDPYDINGDGLVNTSDVVALNKYLRGQLYVPNYQQMDVNRNQIVDSDDANWILLQILGVNHASQFFSREKKELTGHGEINFPTISNSDFENAVLDAHANSTASRRYVKYVYGSLPSNYDGNKLPNSCLNFYNLTPSTTSITQQGQNSTREQVGDEDQRHLATTQPEHAGIVAIVHDVELFNYNNEMILEDTQPSTSTGFIVDDHTIATAAHCVYTPCGEKIYNDVTYYTKERFYTPTITVYNADGTLSNTILTPVEVHISKAYRDNETVGQDYALITVEEDLSNYVHFDLGTSYNITGTKFNHIPIYVTGYGKYNGMSRLFTDEGKVYTSNNVNNSSVLKYDIDTDDGQSGAPVYTITQQTRGNATSYVYTALAIHHGKGKKDGNHSYYLYNDGARVTKYLTQFYLDNPNISY